jgi:hypothetical protein
MDGLIRYREIKTESSGLRWGGDMEGGFIPDMRSDASCSRPEPHHSTIDRRDKLVPDEQLQVKKFRALSSRQNASNLADTGTLECILQS